MRTADVVVIGGGMAGVSMAAELSRSCTVVLLEGAASLGTKATGRSAAAWIASYGPPAVRRLTLASRAFLDRPEIPVAGPVAASLPYVVVAAPGRGQVARRDHESAAETPDLSAALELVDGAEAERRFPVLRPGATEAALVDHSALALDVAAIHQGYAALARSRGALLVTGAPVTGLARVGGSWTVQSGGGETVSTGAVVDAAGAWADRVAGLAAGAGVTPVGLKALRRSVFVSPGAPGAPIAQMPFVNDADQQWYVRPETGQVLASPEDEGETEPGDPRPDELEIARAIDAINEATVLGLRSVRTSWAGVRTFASDGLPVIGPDPVEPSFFWFAGQGGYGIQLAPAAARLGAALLTGSAVPHDIAAAGVRPAELAPSRLAIGGQR